MGSVRDTSPWDHLDYAGKHLIPVRGTIEIDVSDLANTGRVMAEFAETAAQYRVVFDRFEGAAPYQDGGIATRVYEHGDSNHGDPLYPKTWLYLGGRGKVRSTRGQEFGLCFEKVGLHDATRLETYIRNKIS